MPVFVGRDRELAELAAALETAAGGRGQILFVIGDSGRGKTALVQEFARRAQQADVALLSTSGHCNAHTGMGDPYLPFREVLATLVSDGGAKWASGSLSAEAARRLWEATPITVPALVEHAPDLITPFVPVKILQRFAAAFASPDARWIQQLANLTNDDQRIQLEEKRLFAQYTAVLKAIAAQRPLLLILEDLHWIDAASGSLFFHLSREIGDSPIMILGTYRPDQLVGPRPERHPLLSITTELKRQHGDIWLDLSDLSSIEGRRFVDAYLDTQPNRLGDSFRAAFFRQTGGHALFTVELLREMQERGDIYKDAEGYWMEGSAIDWRTLPAKVDGVIETRIEQLDEGFQEILTIASVEGEVFTAEVVARVHQWQERALVQRLSRVLDRQYGLVTAGALEQVGQQRLSRYRFRHYLFQHYLYHRLDATERAYLHEAVGSALESLYGDQSEQVAVQLAYHYEQAGMTEKAVTYLLRAGERAQQLSAHHEAIQQLTQGLTLLALLPDTRQRARQELALQFNLGNALTAINGFAAPETGVAYKRAYELARHMGETPQIFAALHGLHEYHTAHAELQTARTVAEQMLHLAQSQPGPILRVSAHQALGNTFRILGEFGSAREQFEQCAMLYHPQTHSSYVLLFGQDDGAACLARLAWTLWFLGYPDQALQRGHEALTLAQTLTHSFSLAMALNFVILLHLFRQEDHEAQRQAEAMIKLSSDQDFALWLANGTFDRGLALLRQGEEEGILQMERGLSARLATGTEVHKSYFLAGLAEGYAKAGKIEHGLNMLVEALALVNRGDSRFWEAELYRLKGELLLMMSRDTERASTDLFVEAEAAYQLAIDVARRQQGKSLELRATTSLCRLWQAQGKRAEARALLVEIHGWFTEGFSTGDLIEAKALLDRLR